MSTTPTLTADELSAARSQFSAIVSSNGYIFAENAGGSQVLSTVASAITSYLLSTNVQMAAYPLAAAAERRVSRGTCAAAALLGASGPDEVMIGQSATSLVASVARMMEERSVWKDGEIVVSDADHETNRGAWVRLAAKTGCELRHWPVTPLSSPYEVALDPSTLKGLLTPKTRLVAFTACSNLLGHYTDLPTTVSLIRSIAPEAVIAVDCVAFSPHRRLLPREWGVDIAFFSLYKLYGAHVGAMYVSERVKEGYAEKMNHFFLREAKGMYAWQTSSVQYELNYSIAAVADYLVALGRGEVGQGLEVDWNSVFGRGGGEEGLVRMTREQVETALDRAFSKIAAHESALLSVLIPFLLSYKSKGLRIVGPESPSSSTRAPTIAFIITDPSGKHSVGTSKRIHTTLVRDGKLGAQQGHMYAHKLVSSLGLDLEDGVVRLSLVHYNTVEEAQRVTELLGKVLDEVL